MPVSPRDFELYSRMTGTPMPSDAMSRMQMAPEVFEFTKNFARQPNLLEKTGNLIKNIGKIGAYGLGMGMQQSLKAEKRLLKEELRNEQAKRDAEIAEVPESPEQVSAGSGVVQTDLNPIGGSNVRRKVILTNPPQYENEVIDSPFSQQPTTADAYEQDNVPNQTASNIINQKVVQGSQVGDETPNVAQVLSESQDSMPISMFRPTQIPTTGALYAATPIVGEGLSKSGKEVNVIKGVEEEVVGSSATSDKVQNFLKKMGGTDEGSKLDVALIAAMQDRDKKEKFYLGANSGDPSLNISPLLDHPDIVGGEDDINLPGGMNTGSTTNLEDHYKEMRRMDAIERTKNVSPSEKQIRMTNPAFDDPSHHSNAVNRVEPSLFNKLPEGYEVNYGHPVFKDQDDLPTSDAYELDDIAVPISTSEKVDDFTAKFVEGARSDIVRGQRGNQSLGITRIPATNGDSQVGFVLANRPIDQSPTTATTYGFGVAPGAEDIIKGSLDASTFDTYMDRGMSEARQGKKRKAGEIFEFLSPKARIVQGKAALGDIVM